MVKVEVFLLSGCARCSNGLQELEAVTASFGVDRFVWEERNLLQSIDNAVNLGILASPAIAIDGKLAFSSLPSPQQLRERLSAYVTR